MDFRQRRFQPIVSDDGQTRALLHLCFVSAEGRVKDMGNIESSLGLVVYYILSIYRIYSVSSSLPARETRQNGKPLIFTKAI